LTVSDVPVQLEGREVVVGVTGGIAVYKTCDLVSKLVQGGCGVTVAMTEAAQKFVTPLTFEALSQRPVHIGIWNQVDAADTQHIKLTESADLLLVAPATMHCLCKAAAGLCDDIVSLLIAASACPVLLAPSMNDRMWANPATQAAVETLKARGIGFIGPDSGWLACRNQGAGRLSDTSAILEAVAAAVLKT
jgi:phosphopantothenoylcysteine decarboxylase/phosphopantothenate--cysteine ligase